MNWLQIKQTVQQYLENDEATFAGNLGLYARLAEEDIYRAAQLQAAKKLTTAQMTIGDRFITPPVNVLSVYSLSVTEPVSKDYMLLLPKELAFLKEAFPDPLETGMPRFYSWRDDETLMIAPAPDKEYVMEMHSFYVPDSISKDDNNSNETWLSKYGENALLFGIIYHGYINEKGDQDVIQAYKAQFDKGVQDLKVIAEGRQRTDSYRIPA
jgi:hypothetical protein